MKKKLLSIALVSSLFCSVGTASAQNVLTGDTATACEAILCLSTGSPPGECSSALARYFGIKMSKPWKTIRARLDFLKLCPVSNQTPEMKSLVSAISRGAGRCDANSLNVTMRSWRGYSRDDRQFYIRNEMPDYCAAYTGHEYTDIDGTQPRYVGEPSRGGRWVEAGSYDQALAEYNERIRREDEARERARKNNLYGGGR